MAENGINLANNKLTCKLLSTHSAVVDTDLHKTPRLLFSVCSKDNMMISTS